MWFLPDPTPIGGLIADLLETYAGEWWTARDIWIRLQKSRPGLTRSAVRRAVGRITQSGKVTCADRIPYDVPVRKQHYRVLPVEWQVLPPTAADGESPVVIRVRERDYR